MMRPLLRQTNHAVLPVVFCKVVKGVAGFSDGWLSAHACKPPHSDVTLPQKDNGPVEWRLWKSCAGAVTFCDMS